MLEHIQVFDFNGELLHLYELQSDGFYALVYSAIEMPTVIEDLTKSGGFSIV